MGIRAMRVLTISKISGPFLSSTRCKLKLLENKIDKVMYFKFEFLGDCVSENTHATYDNIHSVKIHLILLIKINAFL